MPILLRSWVTPLSVLMWASLAPGLGSRAHAETATFVPVADASVVGSKHDRSTNSGTAATQPSESFQVNLSNPLNAALADAQGVGTIVDNEAPPLMLPLRAAFYVPRYPEAWQVGGQYPHDTPVLGHYDSGSQSVVDAHLAALDAAKVRVSIASWWGQGLHQENTRIPLLLSRTRALQSTLRWALAYEKEGLGSPSVTELQADLDYLRRTYATDPAYAIPNGKPVLFVRSTDDTTCEVADRWAAANQPYGFHVILQAFPGSQNCVSQPAGWYPYTPASAESRQPGSAFAISPGYWKADEPMPRLARDVARWRQTTFNDWGQGTAAEEAQGWTSASHGAYLDALANDGAGVRPHRRADFHGLGHGYVPLSCTVAIPPQY